MAQKSNQRKFAKSADESFRIPSVCRDFPFLLDDSTVRLKAAFIMKALYSLAVVMLLAIGPIASAQPSVQSVSGSPSSAVTKEAVNYVVKVEWKNTDGTTSSLQVTTTEGSFELDTIQKSTVKINNSEIPTTLKLVGTLIAINAQKGRLKLFLGRTIPYVTSTINNGSAMGMASSYSQMSGGLDSAFVVSFGKPLVIQMDDSGKVSVLVTREED
jgi:hypothetical protein